MLVNKFKKKADKDNLKNTLQLHLVLIATYTHYFDTWWSYQFTNDIADRMDFTLYCREYTTCTCKHYITSQYMISKHES